MAAPLLNVLRSVPRSGAWEDLEEEAIVTTAFETYDDIINRNRRTTLADAVLTVLRSRGLEVPELVERTVTVGSIEQLERWLVVASTATTADALLEE